MSPAVEIERPTNGEVRSRAIIRDVDTGDVIARTLSFRGLGNVRIVIEAELQRSGFTLRYEEAVAWRDALSEAIAEIDVWRAEAESHYTGGDEG